MLERSLSVLALSSSSPSRASTFSLTVYLFSVLLINFQVVGTAEDCTHAQWGVLPRGDAQPSHRLRAQAPGQLRLLRDFCNDLPGWIRRHRYGAFVIVWRGTRRWDHRESANFTTVDSGARRTSEPETSLSLSWRKFVASPVLFRTQVRRDPYTNLVRLKNGNQVTTWKTSKPGFSLKDTKSKFLLKSDLRSRSTNFKPSLTEEVSRNWVELSSLSEGK